MSVCAPYGLALAMRMCVLMTMTPAVTYLRIYHICLLLIPSLSRVYPPAYNRLLFIPLYSVKVAHNMMRPYFNISLIFYIPCIMSPTYPHHHHSRGVGSNPSSSVLPSQPTQLFTQMSAKKQVLNLCIIVCLSLPFMFFAVYLWAERERAGVGMLMVRSILPLVLCHVHVLT